MAMEAAKKNPEIVTFGPLIHNPQMVEKLEQAGISSVNAISEIKDRPTIIRSHGIEKDILEKIKNMVSKLSMRLVRMSPKHTNMHDI